MRVMVIVKANKDSEAGVLPNKEILTDSAMKSNGAARLHYVRKHALRPHDERNDLPMCACNFGLIPGLGMTLFRARIAGASGVS